MQNIDRHDVPLVVSQVSFRHNSCSSITRAPFVDRLLPAQNWGHTEITVNKQLKNTPLCTWCARLKYHEVEPAEAQQISDTTHRQYTVTHRNDRGMGKPVFSTRVRCIRCDSF